MNNMSRLALVLLLVLGTGAALAADPEPQSPAPAPTIEPAPTQPGVPGEKVLTPPPAPGKISPMMAEIQATMAASKSAVADLMNRSAGIQDHEAMNTIQREVARLKQQTELDILAIQARYARAEGNEELAKKIDQAIAYILAPPTPEAPAEPRPAPDNQN